MSIHNAAVINVRNTFSKRHRENGYTFYSPVGIPEGEFGLAEIVQEAEIAQHLLDWAGVPKGEGNDADLDTRIAALAWAYVSQRELLDQIMDDHTRMAGPVGTFDDYCVVCQYRWPCPTYRTASGEPPQEDVTSPYGTTPTPNPKEPIT